MEMTIDEAITRYKNNAEYERTHGNLQGCLEFKQLVKWLEKYKKIEKLIDSWELGLIDNIGYEISEVIEDGNDSR